MYCRTAAFGLAAALLASTAATAAELPTLKVKVIGNHSNLMQTKMVEAPFWTEKLGKNSGGKITADYNNQNVLGLDEFQLLRLTGSGVTDFSVGDIAKMAGDDPIFEGCDLAGLTTEVAKARAACDAWKPVMDERMQKRFNTKLLTLGNNAPLALWCNAPVTKLADLRGKKVRVFSSSQVDFVTALGGTTVTMNFTEVVPALQRGVVDCAVTSTMGGNTAGWTEVSTNLFPVGLGWSIYYTAANLDAWKKWPEPVREFMTKETTGLEDDFWKFGQKMTDEGVNCNTSKDPCTIGKKVSMKLIELTPDQIQEKTKLMENTVLVGWAKRCGKECAAKWNDTVGKVLGMKIPLDRI